MEKTQPSDRNQLRGPRDHIQSAVDHTRAAIALTRKAIADTSPVTDAAHAKKMDMGKVPIFQGFVNYFPRAIVAVALVSEYGKRKYAPDAPTFNSGWREVANGLLRYLDADMRHMVKRCIPSLGEYDEESEMAHLAHKAWNALAELERAITDGTVEVRFGVQLNGTTPVPGTSKKVDL